MKTSAAGRKAITTREGVKLVAYKDSGGVLTIGVGHTSAAGAPAVRTGMTISTADADMILSRDLAATEAAVTKAVRVPLQQNQFDALVSLAFNIGAGAFAKSTLVRKLNAGDVVGAADQFLVWNKVNKKTVAGLTTRRKAEREQFLSDGAAPIVTPVKPTVVQAVVTPAAPAATPLAVVKPTVPIVMMPAAGSVFTKLGQLLDKLFRLT